MPVIDDEVTQAALDKNWILIGSGKDYRIENSNSEMTPVELVEQAISTVSRLHLSRLDLGNWNLTHLPDRSWHLITEITELNLAFNQLTTLPSGIASLSALVELNLHDNPLTDLSILQELQNLKVVNFLRVNLPRRYWMNFQDWQPEWLLDEDNAEIRRVLIDRVGYEKICEDLSAIVIDSWREYTLLKIDNIEPRLEFFDFNREITPAEIAKQSIETVNRLRLTRLDLRDRGLTSIPDNCWDLQEIVELDLENNQLTTLPDEIVSLSNLMELNLNNNPLTDLSILQVLPNLEKVKFLDVNLPRRYWTSFSKWKREWLVDEENVKVRDILAAQIASREKYHEQKIVSDLSERPLLEINDVKPMSKHLADEKPIDSDFEILKNREPMVLLKMTCPSTGHIHILRVPPEITSSEAAITWVNHGIHPDEITVQT